jgi:hypothetical protein
LLPVRTRTLYRDGDSAGFAPGSVNSKSNHWQPRSIESRDQTNLMSTFAQGQGADFSSAEQPAAADTSSASSFFSKAWNATQKLASDVGVPDVFSDVQRKVNVLKAQQLGNKLELVEKVSHHYQ